MGAVVVGNQRCPDHCRRGLISPADIGKRMGSSLIIHQVDGHVDINDALEVFEQIVQTTMSNASWPFEQFWRPLFDACERTASCDPVPAGVVSDVAARMAHDMRSGAGWLCVPIADPAQVVVSESSTFFDVDLNDPRSSWLVDHAARAAEGRTAPAAVLSLDMSRNVRISVPLLRHQLAVPADQVDVVGWVFAGWVR